MFANRKRIILDRGPSWPDYSSAEPFVIRYYPLFRTRPKWFPFNILIHKLLKSDLGDLHDHYWSYVTIILKEVIGKQQKRVLSGENQAILDLDAMITDIASKFLMAKQLGL